MLPSFYQQYKLENDGKEPNVWYLDRNFIQGAVIFAACINGAGAGILWTSQGKYLTDCACNENKGFYNAFFFAFWSSSNSIGNLIAAYILDNNVEKTNLFILFGILSVIGSSMFCFLKKPTSHNIEEQPLIKF